MFGTYIIDLTQSLLLTGGKAGRSYQIMEIRISKVYEGQVEDRQMTQVAFKKGSKLTGQGLAKARL